MALGCDIGEPHRLLVQLVAAGLDAGEVEDLVDEMQEVAAAVEDVARVVAVGRIFDRAEQLGLHHLGEAEDGVERRAQLVAHGGKEARLGVVGGFRAPARLVGNRFLLLELGNERVLLAAVFEHRQRGEADAAGQEEEIDVDADGHEGQRKIEGIVQQQQPDHDRDRHRDRAGVEDRRDRRGEHGADRQHDDQRGEDEDVRGEGEVGADAHVLAEAHEREAGEGHAVQQLDDDEAAAPHADVDLPRRQREEAAPLIEQHDFGADDDAEPHDGVEGWSPEHRRDGKQRIERRHGDGGAELVLHEHCQQLVLELGLDAGAGSKPRARRPEILGGTPLRIAPAAAPRDLFGYVATAHVWNPGAGPYEPEH